MSNLAVEEIVARMELATPEAIDSLTYADLAALIASWRGRGEALKAIRESLAAVDAHLRDLANRREPDPENWARHD